MKTNTLDFDAQALREKILDLAMRGKLVPQDPNDEPASVLLEKIKVEKEQLIKEKKIKKSKPLAPITDEEKPFDIPDSWEWVRLGDVINLISGRDIPKKFHLASKSKDSVPYITGASNITENGEIHISEWIDSPSVVVSKGTIILSVKGTIGKIAELNVEKAHIARQIMGIDNAFGLSKEYEKFFLESYIQELKNKAKSMIPGISRDDLLMAEFPLPPLSEQSRIAAKIAQLFALLRKVESSTQQYAKLQTLLKSKVLDLAMRGKLVEQDPHDEPASVLLKKIKAEKEQLIKEGKIKKSKPLPPITDDEKPFDIPNGWEWVRLGDIGAWAAGATPSRKHSEYYGGDIPWLKTGDLNDGIVEETSEKITELGVKNSSVKINKPGNILIAMYGATIGKLGIVGKKELVTNQACCGCTPYKGIYNQYLFYYLLSSRKRLINLGSGGAQPNISKQKIEKFAFPLPPQSEQSRVTAKIEQLLPFLGKVEFSAEQ
ncbi:restriction endonuclease subunit S [Lactobacillus crispatus]|uniref:restriction endonuclease subunit S n=1 Tax=Lactobacillus crispatus TaxID=47770 RepID=UPI000B5D9F53|nr:restriction endonuclease subunit S [Lactobacillus crispatus]OXC31344.1 restriction endonuclease subunit S [Lactobacillus crispatus]